VLGPSAREAGHRGEAGRPGAGGLRPAGRTSWMAVRARAGPPGLATATSRGSGCMFLTTDIALNCTIVSETGGCLERQPMKYQYLTALQK
jgi:hypothetical protein